MQEQTTRLNIKHTNNNENNPSDYFLSDFISASYLFIEFWMEQQRPLCRNLFRRVYHVSRKFTCALCKQPSLVTKVIQALACGRLSFTAAVAIWSIKNTWSSIK